MEEEYPDFLSDPEFEIGDEIKIIDPTLKGYKQIGIVERRGRRYGYYVRLKDGRLIYCLDDYEKVPKNTLQKRKHHYLS